VGLQDQQDQQLVYRSLCTASCGGQLGERCHQGNRAHRHVTASSRQMLVNRASTRRQGQPRGHGRRSQQRDGSPVALRQAPAHAQRAHCGTCPAWNKTLCAWKDWRRSGELSVTPPSCAPVGSRDRHPTSMPHTPLNTQLSNHANRPPADSVENNASPSSRAVSSPPSTCAGPPRWRPAPS
jgi:hypothetical protein